MNEDDMLCCIFSITTATRRARRKENSRKSSSYIHANRKPTDRGRAGVFQTPASQNMNPVMGIKYSTNREKSDIERQKEEMSDEQKGLGRTNLGQIKMQYKSGQVDTEGLICTSIRPY